VTWPGDFTAALAAELSDLTGELWITGPGNGGLADAVLFGPGEETIEVCPQREGPAPAKVLFAGRWPARYRGTPPRPLRTCTASRGPAELARDIRARLLPRYRAGLAELAEREAADAWQRAAREQVMSRAAQMFGVTASGTGTSHRISVLQPGGSSGTITATGPARHLSIDLHDVPADRALLALAIISGTDLPPQELPHPPDPGNSNDA
jgi:hypothetical protein